MTDNVANEAPASGAALVSGLDTASFSSAISPREDFFRHINGEWIDHYELPADRARFGSFDKLAEDAESQIRDILEDPSSPAVKSAALYRSFMDVDAIEAAGADPIRGLLDDIAAAGDKAALTGVLGAINPTGGPDLFGVAVYPDPADPDHNVAHVVQGGIDLPDEAYYREDRYEPVRQAYVAMVARLLTLAGLAGDENDGETAEAMAARFLATETKIAAHHWNVVDTRDEDKINNPADWDELVRRLAHFDLESWTDAWQAAYDAAEGTEAQPVDLKAALSHVVLHEPDFLDGLDGLWASEPLDDWKLWAQVHVLIGSASLLSQDFQDASFDFYGKVLSGTTRQRDRWKRGVSLVNGVCGEEVGQEYVRRHFPASSKERMERLVANLIEAYRVSISSSDWLGEATKARALEKLDKFSPKIGYTNHWRDYAALDVRDGASLMDNRRAATVYETGFQLAKAGKDVDRDEWLMNPQTVNAYYEPSMNVIVFPAAILQPPFFDPAAEDAMNYGGIGAVIGHEIGHGFDDQGSKYDGDGRLHDWWTAEDRERFEERTKALIAQYDAFVPRQLELKYAAEGKADQAPHVNGSLTIGENIGDLGGVNIALKAYALSLGAASGSADDLRAALDTAPVIDGLTGVQRFFAAYASVWRSKNRDELAEQYLAIDPHSPAEFRTNGIVRNVDAFHEAFDVHEGDGMWLAPDQRVRIW